MNRKLYALLVLLPLLTYSCISLDQVSIDYMQPAKINFPSQIKKVAVVNNTIDSKVKGDITKKISKDGVIVLESVCQGNAKKVSEELAQKIAEANYFDQVLICDSALRENDHFTRNQELTKNEVQKLTSDLDVDLLIAVEDIAIKRSQIMEVLPNFFHAVIDVKVAPLIRIYLPNRSKPMVSIQPEDSIFWEGYGETEAIAKRELKEEKQIDEASQFAGTLPSKYILPTWNKANRYYYINGSFELKDAAVYVRESNWDKALELWQTAYNSKNKKIKYRAAYNTALYYELNDSIDKAIEWAEKAEQLLEQKGDKTFNTFITKEYISKLQTRKTEIQTLNIQMSRFKDNF